MSLSLRLGLRYQHYLTHGWTCACHNPQAQQICARIDKGLSRRSVLKGVAASLAVPALGIVSPAFAQNPVKPTLLRNVSIFDGASSKLVEGRDVLVEGKLIKALVASGEAVGDVDMIDCGGRTLMPGMIDAHWHSILAGISQIAAMTADVPYVHLVAAQEAERTVLRGFIPASVGIDVCVKAINLAIAGGTYVPATSVFAMRQALKSSSEMRETPALFTPRQAAVGQALRQGKANKIIAYELSMCESTVKVHVRNIMKKLKATNRTEVAYKLNGLTMQGDGLDGGGVYR